MHARRIHRLVVGIVALVATTAATAQVAYPPHVIQDETWTSGVHNVAVSNKILSPGSAGGPVHISGTAQAEFTSGEEIHLTDGFHAGGFTGAGQHFRARIIPASTGVDDVVAIAPDPATSVVDNVLHVPKWEKVEIGVQLPQEYQDAINGFFQHYYPNGYHETGGTSETTPDQVDQAHDLNPYADDSLQLTMVLSSPSNATRLKWGFFMKEGKWGNALVPDAALLTEDLSDPLHPYSIRFRFAPHEEGLWRLTLSAKAPHTTTLANAALPDLQYTGYSFVCDPSIADNHGFLKVNALNQRTLQFEDGTSFFGMGTNMADVRCAKPPGGVDFAFHQRDFNIMQQSMVELHEVGGNYMRMYLMPRIFAPEFVNLGVYDAFRAPDPCTIPSTTPTMWGNCQFQCWAFDRMLDKARDNNIYVQLALDPYPPVIAYENLGWGNHPYFIQFVRPHLQVAPQNKYDLKRFFYDEGDPANTADGVFYFWKRKYKYMMARWGYSVNLAILEPFNEIDQMLSYQTTTISSICDEDDGTWNADATLPPTINTWVTDIAAYVKGVADPNNPVASSLGEDKKLFLMSYTDGQPHTNAAHYLPFTNTNVSLIDVHKGLGGEQAVNATFGESKDFHNTFMSGGVKKPFHHGEYSTFGDIAGYSTHQFFSNYDVSFHNEIWASAFSGNFTTGLSWAWDRVFWWPKALPSAPNPNNQFQLNPPTRGRGDLNMIDIGIGTGYPVENKSVIHNIKPLVELLSNPDWQAYDFFNGEFNSHRWLENGHKIECYYLLDTTHTLAIGWIHNMNAYWENNYYVRNTLQNFLGSTAPWVDWHTIQGFQPGLDYHVSWFPTRTNTTVRPVDYVDASQTGLITLDMSSAPFAGVFNNYLDTLHSDYAFIISINPVVRSMVGGVGVTATDWDFAMYPNPTNDDLFIRLQDDTRKDITLYDYSGRQVQISHRAEGRVVHLSTGNLARGTYCVRVSDSRRSIAKTVILR